MTNGAPPLRLSPLPVDSAALPIWLQGASRMIETTVAEISLMTPQAATAAPKTVRDGMVRLARSPWRPASGQSADAWVYFDAPSGTWKLL